MDLKYFLIFFLSIFTIASSQSLSCNFTISYGSYICDLTIDNPTGIDGFSGINGFHVDGKTNSDVNEIQVETGNTPIIPQIICDSFQSLETIRILSDVGIKNYTENALKNCLKLTLFYSISNPVTEIHPNFFHNNVELFQVYLADLQVTTLSEELFSTTTQLRTLGVYNSHSLSDLPLNIFKNNLMISSLGLSNNHLSFWRAEWTQSLTKLVNIYLSENNISVVSANVTNSDRLTFFNVGQNRIKVIDSFMFNDVSQANTFYLEESPIEAIDFNLVDRATYLRSLIAMGCSCIDKDFFNFHLNREVYMAELEPCFAAYERQQELTFSTQGTALRFISIRKEFINVQIQAVSDAIIRFASNPDGSGSNFEVKIGVDDNMQSCIYENNIQRTCSATPGILSPIQMRSFTIMWSGGFVYVMHGNPLMFYNLATPFKVRFVGVGTSSGSNASWIIE